MKTAIACAAALLTGLLATATATAAEGSPVLKNGRIGYVLTDLYWSIYQTANAKSECPKGFNDGPREQFEALFKGVKAKTVVDTQLKQEIATWLPTPDPDSFPFHEATGTTALGLNLDGKVGPHDFTSPDGEKGVDNQLYRALGCIIGFRGPDGVEFIFENKAITSDRYNRLMIELTNVDNLQNDPDVHVAIYRGRDRLLTDASGNKVVSGGSQQIDTRWGAPLVREMKGKIVDGVLITEPITDLVIPWENLSVPTFQLMRDARFRLKLDSDAAQGMLAGYTDVDTWYKQLIRNDSTHHLSNGQISGISLYKALRRLADAYPDPATHANTAISSALNAKFVQVYIQPLDAEGKAQIARAMAKREQLQKQVALTSNLQGVTVRQQ